MRTLADRLALPSGPWSPRSIFKQKARREGDPAGLWKADIELSDVCGGSDMVKTSIGRRGSTRVKKLRTGYRSQGIQPCRRFLSRESFPLELSPPDRVSWRGWEELNWTVFKGSKRWSTVPASTTSKKRTLCCAGSRAGRENVTAAIDEFMLDFMTLVFVVETGEEGFEKPTRKLARTRLSKLKQLVGVPA